MNELIQLITALALPIAGVFSMIKWINSIKRDVKNERFRNYVELIRVISGNKNLNGESPNIAEQITSIWLLLEYKEFYNITLKVFNNDIFETMSNKNFKDCVLPQIKLLISEIKNK